MEGNYKTEITNPAVRELTEKFYNGELDGFVKYVKSRYTVDEAKDYLFNECQHTDTKEMKEFIDATIKLIYPESIKDNSIAVIGVSDKIANNAGREFVRNFCDGKLEDFEEYMKSHYTADGAKEYLFNHYACKYDKKLKDDIELIIEKIYPESKDEVENTTEANIAPEPKESPKPYTDDKTILDELSDYNHMFGDNTKEAEDNFDYEKYERNSKQSMDFFKRNYNIPAMQQIMEKNKEDEQAKLLEKDIEREKLKSFKEATKVENKKEAEHNSKLIARPIVDALNKEFTHAMNKEKENERIEGLITGTYNTMAGPNDYYSDKPLNEGSTSVTTTATLNTNKRKSFYTEEVQRMYMEADLISDKKRIDNLAERSVINETAFESYFLTILNLYKPKTNDPEVKETLKRIFKSISALTKEASEIAREKEDIRHILRNLSEKPYFDEYFKTVFEGYTLDDLLYEHTKSVEEEQDKPIEMFGYTEDEMKEQLKETEKERKLQKLNEEEQKYLNKYGHVLVDGEEVYRLGSQVETDFDKDDSMIEDLNDEMLPLENYKYSKSDNIESVMEIMEHPERGDEGERLTTSIVQTIKEHIDEDAERLVRAEIDYSERNIDKRTFNDIKDEVSDSKQYCKDNLMKLIHRNRFNYIFNDIFNPYTVQDLIDGRVI